MSTVLSTVFFFRASWWSSKVLHATHYLKEAGCYIFFFTGGPNHCEPCRKSHTKGKKFCNYRMPGQQMWHTWWEWLLCRLKNEHTGVASPELFHATIYYFTKCESRLAGLTFKVDNQLLLDNHCVAHNLRCKFLQKRRGGESSIYIHCWKLSCVICISRTP